MEQEEYEIEIVKTPEEEKQEVLEKEEYELERAKTESQLFIEKMCGSEQEKKLLGDVLRRKREQKKSKARDLANTVRDISESEYITFRDGKGLTINEILGARVTANLLAKEDIEAKDLLEYQKITHSNQEELNVGVKIEFVTHGQDLGE